jgi:hypothetical protein
MKRLRGLAILVLLLPLSGCGDENGPTAPGGTLRGELSGQWTGTITYFQEEGQRQAACALERIETVISQAGDQVTAPIITACHGTLELSGTVVGNSLTGSLAGGPQGSGGRVAGFASPSRIELTTSRGRADDPVAVNRIELGR